MANAVQEIEIKATPKQCYDVVWAFENYPEFIGDLKEVEIANKKGNACEVTYTIKVIKKITYTLKMKGTPGKKVEWSFVKGDFMKDNFGHWEFKEIKKGVTKATYDVSINFGILVPGSVSKMLVGKNLPAMLKAFKERIEASV
ncbi:MAG: SRPBCC family protein [Deltaproteobacteria bacterium]|nr:SRPBCC family protein [Deltaproteobacteria bacterium]